MATVAPHCSPKNTSCRATVPAAQWARTKYSSIKVFEVVFLAAHSFEKLYQLVWLVGCTWGTKVKHSNIMRRKHYGGLGALGKIFFMQVWKISHPYKHV